MELLLVRHALPMRVELASGIADPPLSEVGHQQAKLLAEYLAGERLDAVYTSPLRRAAETAAPLAADRGIEVRELAEVAEWDRSSNEYVPIEELRAADDPRWRALLDGAWTSEEESAEDFAARVLAALDGVVAAHGGQRVAVVCHGGVINAYLATVLERADHRPFFYPNYTSIHRVAASRRGHRSIVTVNETAHLRRTGLPMGLFQEG